MLRLSLSAFLACFVFGLRPTAALSIPEQDLWGERSKELMRWYERDSSSGSLRIEDGVYLSWRAFNRKCGDTAVIIIEGRTEFQQKYAELTFDLFKKGLCVYTYDHRGQGLSSRLVDDHQKSHVEHFSDYTSDLLAFDNAIVRPNHYKRVFLFGNSMGGLIAAQYASQTTLPISGVILSAPMFDIRTNPLPAFVVHAAAWIMTKIKRGEKWGWKQVPWDPARDTFESNRTTSSRRRYDVTLSAFILHPEAAIGGATWRWILESQRATSGAIGLAKSIKAPLLVFQAPRDTFVKPGAQQKFCSRAASCQLRIAPNAKHEIFQEIDATRNYAMGEMLKFIDAH